MHAAVNTLVVLGASLASLVALTASAEPPASREAEEARWTPSLALTSGILFQRQEASVASFVESTGGPLRPGVRGSDWDVAPHVGASLELMTPAMARLPGRPRVFIVGEALPTFSTNRETATEGKVGEYTFPNQEPKFYPAAVVGGTGSFTSAQVRRYVWAAGIGVAFPFELRGRQLLVKPSFGWLRYEIGVTGRVREVLKDDDGEPNDDPTDQVPDGEYGPNFRFIDLSGRESMVLHGIGPGLELEMELARRGPLRPTLFFHAHAYKVLGDRSVDFSDSVTISDATDWFWGVETYNADWSFEVDPWIYRAGVGLRFRWLGK